MSKYMILHYGFEKPTPEIMAAWGKWFESIAPRTLDQGGFTGGKEISDAGSKDLPWGMESITGYNIIEAKDLDAAEAIASTIDAESLEEAERIAASNPYIASIRVYEIRSK